MQKKLGRVGVLSLAATVLAALTGCANTATTEATPSAPATSGGEAVVEETVAKINFGYITDFSGTSLLAISKELGLWEKYNIDARYFTFTNGPLQIQAMGTGDLDFGFIGPGAFWLPASGQSKFISINNISDADRVIVRADSGITSMEQLRGKEVAYPGGTSGEQILRLALEAAGMTIDDVIPVIMDPSTLVAAFSAGQIDAAGIWYPNVGVIKNSVDIVELATNSDFTDKVSFPSAFIASNSIVESDPEVVARVQAVLKEANDYRYNNLDATVEIVAKQLGLDVDVVAQEKSFAKLLSTAELEAFTGDGTVIRWLDALNTSFIEAGRFETLPDAASTFLIDSYLSAKVRE
jgi:NitT/TauT family transport system substrate-binding protein